jgi:hypothetical protein
VALLCRYWSFMQKRRWGSYKKGSAAAAAAGHAGHDAAGPAAASFHQQPEHKNALRSQLAGLRHRAAIRANKRGPRWSAAAAAEAGSESGTETDRESQQEQQNKQPEAMASLDIDSSEMGDGCNMSSGETHLEGRGAVIEQDRCCLEGWSIGSHQVAIIVVACQPHVPPGQL